MSKTEDAILKNLQTFTAFARQRLGDAHLAEDVVQESLLKAMAAGRQPAGEENTVAWFYRILRRSIIDIYRRKEARRRALERFEQELPENPLPADERVLCHCFKRLLPQLPQQYRELLDAVDLQGREIGVVADQLGVTRNNLTVRLHRARQRLREALAKNCQACSEHGCLDCTCGEPAGEPQRRTSAHAVPTAAGRGRISPRRKAPARQK